VKIRLLDRNGFLGRWCTPQPGGGRAEDCGGALHRIHVPRCAAIGYPSTLSDATRSDHTPSLASMWQRCKITAALFTASMFLVALVMSTPWHKLLRIAARVSAHHLQQCSGCTRECCCAEKLAWYLSAYSHDRSSMFHDVHLNVCESCFSMLPTGIYNSNSVQPVVSIERPVFYRERASGCNLMRPIGQPVNNLRTSTLWSNPRVALTMLCGCISGNACDAISCSAGLYSALAYAGAQASKNCSTSTPLSCAALTNIHARAHKIHNMQQENKCPYSIQCL